MSFFSDVSMYQGLVGLALFVRGNGAARHIVMRLRGDKSGIARIRIDKKLRGHDGIYMTLTSDRDTY